ncbi:hypothetical protein FRB96_007988, partial [Tulasnella sp. 330]
MTRHYGGKLFQLSSSTSTTVNEEQHVEIERLKIDEDSVAFAINNDNAGSEIIGRKWVMKLGDASPGGMAAIGVMGSPSTMGTALLCMALTNPPLL